MISTQPRHQRQMFNPNNPCPLNILTSPRSSFPNSSIAVKSVIRIREPYLTKSQINQDLVRASTTRHLLPNINSTTNKLGIQTQPKLVTQSHKNLLRRPKQWDNIMGKSEYNLSDHHNRTKNWLVEQQPLVEKKQLLVKSKINQQQTASLKFGSTMIEPQQKANPFAKHNITAQSLNQVLAALPKKYQTAAVPSQKIPTTITAKKSQIFPNISTQFPSKPPPRLFNSKQTTTISKVQFSRPNIPNRQHYQQAIYQLRPKPILKVPVLKLANKNNMYSPSNRTNLYDNHEKLVYHKIPTLEYYNIVDNSVQTEEDSKSNSDNLKLIQQILDDLKDFLLTHKKNVNNNTSSRNGQKRGNKLVEKLPDELERQYSQEFSKRPDDSPNSSGGNDFVEPFSSSSQSSSSLPSSPSTSKEIKSRIVFDSIEEEKEENEELIQIDEEKNKRLSFIHVNGIDVNCAGLLSMAKPYSALIQETFTSIDTNNSGFVQIEDAERVIFGFNTRFGKNLSKEEIRAFCLQLDSDCDGKINLEQFSSVFMNCAI